MTRDQQLKDHLLGHGSSIEKLPGHAYISRHRERRRRETVGDDNLDHLFWWAICMFGCMRRQRESWVAEME